MIEAVPVPTVRFWILFALAIPLSYLGYVAGVPSLPWIYDILIIVVAFITSRFGPRPETILFSRHHEAVLSARVANRIEITVENEGDFLAEFRMRDEPPTQFQCDRREFTVSLMPGAKANFIYNAVPPERGDDEFKGTFIRFKCPLGLVTTQFLKPTIEPIRVYPNVIAMSKFALLNQKGRLREIGVRRAHMRGLGSEFESLREYALGDDYRKIDWKATARRGHLIVRQYEVERNQTVLIAIDIGRHMIGEIKDIPKLDSAIDAALMLLRAAAIVGDQVGLLVYSDVVVRFIPPAKGRNQLGRIVEALHDIIAIPVESDPIKAFAFLTSRWNRRSFLVHFTDSGDKDRAKALGIAMKPIVRRHLALQVRVSDPELKKALTGPLVHPDDLYNRAAALMIDEDRKEATIALTNAGLRSIESEPQDLAASLVTFYYDVKERALI